MGLHALGLWLSAAAGSFYTLALVLAVVAIGIQFRDEERLVRLLERRR